MRYLLSCFNRILAVVVVIGMLVGPSTRAYAGTRLPAVEAEVFPLWIPFAGAPKAVLNGVLYFDADDGVHGHELWKSDGTEAGTVMVKDILPGSVGAGVGAIDLIGNTFYFFANDGLHTVELWKSDGTEAGTVMVKAINPGPEAGTAMVKDINSGNDDSARTSFSILGNVFLFTADDGNHGTELWRSDGTEVGTMMVKEIITDTLNSHQFDDLTVVGSHLFFTIEGLLWKSDGTEAGTVLVKDFGTLDHASGPRYVSAAGDLLYFSMSTGTYGEELWKSDGSEAGTVMVKDINPGSGDANPGYRDAIGDTIYFEANDGVHGEELWKSDGTEAGTVMVKEIYTGIGGSVDFVTAIGNTIYYAGLDTAHGYELWKSDGTAEGTTLVKDINPGNLWSYPGHYPEYLMVMGSTIYFAASDETNGRELWRSDGTEAGTVLIKDMIPGPADSTPMRLVAIGESVLFEMDDGIHGLELWKSDGTEAGTVMLKDINPGSESSSPYWTPPLWGGPYMQRFGSKR